MISVVTAERVIACLTELDLLEQSESGSRWRAGTLDLEGGGVFGGELLGQAIAVASRLDPSMPVKSIQAVFPRGVRDVGSVELDAATLHRGSAYFTQRVEVTQPDRNGNPATAFSAQVISHRPGAGVEHQMPMPEHAGSPDDARSVDLGVIPWETRLVGDVDLNDRAAQENELLLWTRVRGDALSACGHDILVHQVLLAFLSDLTLIGTALLAHDGWCQLDAHGDLRTSVISHQLLFHRPFRIDEWLLIHQSSPVATGGSAFGTGHVYSRSGELVASVAQESMLRVAEASA